QILDANLSHRFTISLPRSPSPARSVGEGGRRPDEGSFAQLALISTSTPAETKSPHPPFGHPLPLLRNGRRGKLVMVSPTSACSSAYSGNFDTMTNIKVPASMVAKE